MTVRLAFDTATGLGSVAVAVRGQVAARAFLEEQGAHAARLVPAIMQVLEEAGVDRTELEEVVVGSGPGSFTGVRVAAATAKGLVRGLGIPLRAFSSLAAAALGPELELPPGPAEELSRILRAGERGRGGVPDIPGSEELRYVLFDARGDRIYGGCYRVGPEGLAEVRAPWAGRIGEVLTREIEPGTRFAGDGAFRHREVLEAKGFRILSPPVGVPTADGLLFLASRSGERGRVEEPARWEPDYLRPWAGEAPS